MISRFAATPKLAWALGITLGVALCGPAIATNSSSAAAGIDRLERQLHQGINDSTFELAPHTFVQWMLLRNPEILIAEETVRIAEQQLRSDRGVYQPELFATLERSENERRNSLDRPDQPVLEDNQTYAQIGVRTLIPTGGQISLSYEARDRVSNASSGDDPEGFDDVIANLRIELRQPLLRGRGAVDLKTRMQQSASEVQIAKHEMRQRLLMSSFEALNLYWNLYRTEQLYRISSDSLENARRLREDAQRLVDAGRLPQNALADARSSEFIREAERTAARQQRLEVAAEMRRMLNLSTARGGQWTFTATQGPSHQPAQAPADFETYFFQVLEIWPNYQIANERIAISEQSLRAASDQRRSRLDLVMSYGQNSRDFDSSLSTAFEDAWRDDFPEWRVGLEWSMPLGRNQTGRAEEAMARSRMLQGYWQAEVARTTLSNQLFNRVQQVHSTWEEWQFHQANVDVLNDLLITEQQAFNRGESSVRRVIEREDQRNIAHMRAIDTQVRFELAKTALSLSDGSLLDDLSIELVAATDGY